MGMGKEKQQGLDHRHMMHRASDMGGGLVTWGRAAGVVSIDRFPVEMKA